MSGWWGHSIYAQFGGGDPGLVAVVSCVVVVIGSITLHELGHGWAALWEGDNTPRELGHMTANPLVHMGGSSLLIFAIMGIAWGMMPVRPDRFRHGNGGRILVAMAGPAVNLGLFLIFATGLGLLQRSGMESAFTHNLSIFLMIGGMLNIGLLLLNLLPIPPLDGWRMLEGCHWKIRALSNHPNAPIASLFVLFALLMMGPIRWIFVAAAQTTAWWSSLIAS